MTNEEAKDYIREWCPYDRQDEIIKALSKSDGDCIKVPKGATNGDMVKAMFSKATILTESHYGMVKVWFGNHYNLYREDWWNSPYKKEVSE